MIKSDSSKSYLSGNFTISLDLFPDQRYVSAYTANDFPINVVLRKRLYFQVNVKSSDSGLSVLAQDCYGTPTQNQNDRLKFSVIKNG
jgi:type IV secretory pathway TraG/TraD family ATPase VirD4